MAEIASAFVSLLPSARGFGPKLQSEVGGEVSSAGKKLGTGFGKAFAAGGAIVAAAGVGSFFKSAITGAGELEQSVGAIDTVFGKSAKKMHSWSKAAAQNVGLTQNEFNELGTLIGSQLKNGGTAMDQLAPKTKNLISTGADLSSMFGGTTKEAVEALSSALKGERDPIERYGVSLNQAKIDSEAAALGFKKVDGGLSQQAQQAATLSLIMKQTGDAQGNFAKESGTLAGQQQRLGAQFGNLKTTVGTAFLPVMTKVVGFLNSSLLPAIGGLGPVFGKIVGFLAPVVAKVQGFFGGGSGGGILSSIKSFGSTIASNFLPVLQSMASTFTTKVLPAVTAVAGYIASNLFPIFRQIADIIVTNVVPIIAKFAQFLYGTLYPAVLNIVAAIASKLKPVFDQLVATFRSQVLPTIQKLLVKFEEYRPTIQKVITAVAKVVGKVLEFAAAILGKVLPVAIKFAGFLIANVVPAVANVIGVVIKIIGKIVEFGGALVDGVKKVGNFAQGVGEKIGKVIGFFRDLPAKVLGFIAGLGTDLFNAGGKLVTMLANGIKAKATEAINALKDIADRLKGLLPGSPIKWGPLKNWNNGGAGKRLMDLVARGIEQGTPKTLKAAKTAFGKIGDALESERDNLRSTLDGLKGDFASLAESVSSAFTGNLFESVTSSDFIASLMGKRGELTGLLASFKTLQGWGLDPAFLSQLFQSGNGALINDLASLGKTGAMQAGALFGEVTSLSSQLGNAVAKNDPVADRIDVTNKKLDQVIDQLSYLGKDVGDAVNGAVARGQKRRKNQGGK